MRKLLALLTALCLCFAAPCAAVKAETASAAQTADGTLRVWLQSLGDRKSVV